ncbi:hypothetical protein J6590_033617 [Homalodisca vitripennis]|nr:hypothetical protein J6590_033617 [Homalodisca vitripennis]
MAVAVDLATIFPYQISTTSCTLSLPARNTWFTETASDTPPLRCQTSLGIDLCLAHAYTPFLPRQTSVCIVRLESFSLEPALEGNSSLLSSVLILSTQEQVSD